MGEKHKNIIKTKKKLVKFFSLKKTSNTFEKLVKNALESTHQILKSSNCNESYD